MKSAKQLQYDKTSAESILQYGERLLNHSLRQLYPDAKIFKGKGGLGNSVEYYHYDYEPNSESEPDFPEAGIELKCTPLKQLNDDSMAAKERLVLNIINYVEEADRDFETSSFWHKNKFLLLMFYLHQSGVDPVDMLFKLIRTWTFPDEDLKIIRDDWAKIHSMILSGHAEDLTEGSTLYLAACMKGSKSGAEKRIQPYSDVRAQQRAYSLKQGYMNKVIFVSYLDPTLRHQLSLSPNRIKKLKRKYGNDPAVKSTLDYNEGETFEQLIERNISRFYGKTIYQISTETGIKFNTASKDLAYHVCRAMLGVKSKRIQEFENAGISLKSLALEPNGEKIKESMSFPYIRFVDIVNQEWEDSDWYQKLTSRFLFVVFRKSADGNRLNMKLEKILFWNMPKADLDIAERLWFDTKLKTERGDYNNFITSKKTLGICHVRPHGTKGQTVETPQGFRVQPKCFWLNNDYILNVVK